MMDTNLGVLMLLRFSEKLNLANAENTLKAAMVIIKWSIQSMKAFDAINGALPYDEVESEQVDEEDLEWELIEHTYVLRPDLTISIELPDDLTSHLAYRLSCFIDWLSFERGD